MKLVVSCKVLLHHIDLVSPVMRPNPIIAVLENILFNVNEEGILTMTGSDLGASIETSCQVEKSVPGVMAIPAKILRETISKFNDQPITISQIKDTMAVNISADTGKYKITTEQEGDYPKFEFGQAECEFKLPADELAQAIDYCHFAVGTDQLRPAMTGVCMDVSKGYLQLFATDGHRLVKYSRKDIACDQHARIIIPGRTASAIREAITPDGTQVTIAFNRSHIMVTSDKVKLISRLIGEKFPDVESVIPKENKIIVTLNRTQAIASVKRVSLYAHKKTKQMSMKAQGNTVELSAENVDMSTGATEKLPCQHKGEILIGFNSKFLLSALTHINSEEISFFMSEPDRPALIKPEITDEGKREEELTILLMPIILY